MIEAVLDRHLERAAGRVVGVLQLDRKARCRALVAFEQTPDLAVDRIPVQPLLRLGDARLQFRQRLLDARAEALVHRLFLLEAILRSA